MKKRWIAAAAVLVFLLAAGCGKDDGELVDEYVYRYSSVGEIVDTGDLKAVCPTGWTNVEAYDLTASVSEPVSYILEFVKGANSDAADKPFIRIVRHLSDEIWSTPSRDTYDDVFDVTPVTAGTRTWKGFGGYVNGQQFIWVSASDPEGYTLEAWLWTHPDGETQASFDDTDVGKILESVVAAVPEKKGR